MITPVSYLEARDPARNIHRAYSIAYGQDLFGNWIVETTYGRIGGKGRYTYASDAEGKYRKPDDRSNPTAQI